MSINVKTLLIIVLAMIAGLLSSMRAGAQSNEWQPPEFFAAFDVDGSGAVHVPELDEWGEFCLTGYQCAGGTLTWNHRDEPEYEVLLRADGSGYVYVVDDIYGFFCINGWDCAVVDPLPDPCDVDPGAIECVWVDEPVIVWQEMWLPAIMLNHIEPVIGLPVCGECDDDSCWSVPC